MKGAKETFLCEAAYEGNIDLVRQYIEREGVNPNCIHYFMPPLLHACSGRAEGCIDVFRYLTEEAHVDVTAAVYEETGMNALHVACRNGAYLPMVRHLVEVVGLSVHKTDNDGNTALHYACRSNRKKNDPLDIVKYLVETQNANVEARNQVHSRHDYDLGETPLHVAFESSAPQATQKVAIEDVVLYLLPRMESFDKQDLFLLWRHRMSWNVKEAALRQYAMVGDGILDGEALELNPIHTILGFPLPSTDAFLDCIQHFSWATTSRGSLLLDKQGRFPIHVALSNARARTRQVVSALIDLEPRSSLARDPSTGLYPCESVGLLQEHNGESDHDAIGWLNAIYKLFRPDPTLLLQTRGLVTSLEEKA